MSSGSVSVSLLILFTIKLLVSWFLFLFPFFSLFLEDKGPLDITLKKKAKIIHGKMRLILDGTVKRPQQPREREGNRMRKRKKKISKVDDEWLVV